MWVRVYLYSFSPQIILGGCTGPLQTEDLTIIIDHVSNLPRAQDLVNYARAVIAIYGASILHYETEKTIKIL
jgi:hypothetical protein